MAGAPEGSAGQRRALADYMLKVRVCLPQPETVNGPVTLEVPADYSAKLETGTVHGPIDVDFPLTVTLGSGRMRRFNATLGSGGPTVRVVTTNGPSAVLTRNPVPSWVKTKRSSCKFTVNPDRTR